MSQLCDSTVAGPTAKGDNALASKCESPPFHYSSFKCALVISAHFPTGARISYSSMGTKTLPNQFATDLGKVILAR